MRSAIAYILALFFCSALCAEVYDGIYWHKDVKRFLAKETNKYNNNVLELEKDYFKKLIDLVNQGETFWDIKTQYPKAIKDLTGAELSDIYELRSGYNGFARRIYYFIYDAKEVYYLYAETKNGQADTESTSKLTKQILKKRKLEIVRTRSDGQYIISTNKNWSEVPKSILGVDIVLDADIVDLTEHNKSVEVYYGSAAIFGKGDIATKFQVAPKVEGCSYDIRSMVFKFNDGQDELFSQGIVEDVSPVTRKNLVVDFIYSLADKMNITVPSYAVAQEADVYYLFIKATAPDPTLLALRGFFDGTARLSDVNKALSKEQIDKLISVFEDGTVAALYDEFLPEADVELAKAKLKLLKELQNPKQVKTPVEPKPEVKITGKSDIEDISSALEKAPITDVDLLLGRDGTTGLLELAMDKASEEVSTDYKNSSALSALVYVMINKLMDNTLDEVQEKKLELLIPKYTELDIVVKKCSKPTQEYSNSTLDEILEKKELGKTEFSKLFEQDIAKEISKAYKAAPNDPVKAVRVLVIEGLRRKFEIIANSNVSVDLTTRIVENDYFKLDSKTHKDWKLVTEELATKDLKPRTEEEKRILDDYKNKTELIKDFRAKP